MKREKIIFWIITGYLFLFEGLGSLYTLFFAPEAAKRGPLHLGYPEYFTYINLGFMILGATALILVKLPRPVKEWAYAGLVFNFICAAISHFIVDGLTFSGFFPLIFLVLTIVSYLYNLKLYTLKPVNHGKDGL